MCGTNEDAVTVLVAIDGTEMEEDRIVEAAPVHLACAVATNYNRKASALYTRTAPDASQSQTREKETEHG